MDYKNKYYASSLRVHDGDGASSSTRRVFDPSSIRDTLEHMGVITKLRRYQLEGISWMLSRCDDNDAVERDASTRGVNAHSPCAVFVESIDAQGCCLFAVICVCCEPFSYSVLLQVDNVKVFAEVTLEKETMSAWPCSTCSPAFLSRERCLAPHASTTSTLSSSWWPLSRNTLCVRPLQRRHRTP
jgi:hypothetical protein